MNSGDELQAFCRREHPRLVRMLTVYCGDVEAAQEFAQEALVRACARWGQVSRMDAPGPWVHRVAINLANSWFRRRRAERRAGLRHGAPEERGEPEVAESIAIRQAIRRLPERQRAVLALRFYLELSVAETAHVMGSSEGAVKQHTARAVAALRARFVPTEVADEGGRRD